MEKVENGGRLGPFAKTPPPKRLAGSASVHCYLPNELQNTVLNATPTLDSLPRCLGSGGLHWAAGARLADWLAAQGIRLRAVFSAAWHEGSAVLDVMPMSGGVRRDVWISPPPPQRRDGQ